MTHLLIKDCTQDQRFSIHARDAAHCKLIRETLRQLGYKIYATFDTDTELKECGIVYDTLDISRSHCRTRYETHFESIEELLTFHMLPRKTEAQLKKERLLAQIAELQAEVETLA